MNSAAGGLPNFFLIGAQKSGTTTLHRLLQGHPEVFLSDPKEPQYFAGAGERRAAGGPDQRDAPALDWYRSLFAGAGAAAAIGEASTTYSMFPFYSGVPARLIEMVPDPLLIYLVRDPIVRMRSSYQHALAAGSETRSLEQALRSDPRYLLLSSYSLQIEQWLAVVPRDRVLLLDFDRLVADPVGLVRQTLGFLGVSTDWTPAAAGESFNESAAKRAPRAWWRTLGEGIRRAELHGGVGERIAHSERLARAAGRVEASSRAVARRPIGADEVAVSAALDLELRRALAEDLSRFRVHWGAQPSPGWLQDESSASRTASTLT